MLFTAALATLVAAAPAAAKAPTLGRMQIFKAGQKSPVDVGVNGLQRGDRIPKGTELRRWLVTMHGRTSAVTTLSCGPGSVHRGLGTQPRPRVAFGVVSKYGYRTIKVRAFPTPRVNPNGAKASIYAHCRRKKA